MLRVVILGAGRVAWHLATSLQAGGIAIAQVYNRSAAPAARLAERLGAAHTSDLGQLCLDADVYLLAVSDAAIVPLADQLRDLGLANALVVHTSGATPVAALAPLFPRCGVFYPLQTFSVEKPVDFTTVPLCLYAAQASDLPLLLQMAHALGAPSHILDDEQRAMLHVAAVFVNNFTNHLFFVADDLLGRAGVPFSLLQPLITETAAKVQALSPAQAQTGPAQRGDQVTIARHLAALAAHPSYQALYQLLTAGIEAQEPPHDRPARASRPDGGR